jgi:DNA-binding GntR family transcriptional regulator
MLNDMDADYSPQYVKLARILRDKIKSGELSRLTPMPASDLAAKFHVSTSVASAALEMLAANRFLERPGGVRSYCVIWDPRTSRPTDSTSTCASVAPSTPLVT